MNESLTFKEVLILRFQDLAGRIVVPIGWILGAFYLRFIRRVRVPNHKTVRASYRRLVLESDVPVIICANHLTMFDSVYLHYGLGSYLTYMLRFRLFSWNVAAVEVFKSKFFWSFLTYFGRTLLVDRQGESDHQNP